MKNKLIITNIQMQLKDGNGMVICNIVLNDMISLNDIRVIKNKDRKLIIAMPSKKMPDRSFRAMANPVNPVAREIIEDAIISEYLRLTSLS